MKKINKISTLVLMLIALIIFGATNGTAAPGDLDPTFSGDGKLTDWLGAARGVALQPDGKIVVVGTNANYSAFAVARYNPDGSPDTNFGGGDGKVTTDIGFSDEGANAVALQSDGKIVAVGTTWDGSGSQWGHFSLVRYNPDGSLDLTFGGGDGIVVTENLGTGWVAANTVAIQADGKIVAAGRTDYLLYDFPELTVIRYNPDGSLDLPFGGSGGKARIPWGPGPFGGNAPPVEDATSIAIQPDGKIIAAGYSYGFWLYSALVRLNSNGSIDATFGGGVVFTDIGPGADVAHSVAILPDGKIVTAGSSYNGSNDDFALVRYTSDGSVDTTFHFDGKVVTPIGSGNAVARTVAVQSDGKILVAGYSDNGLNDDFALARYNSDGSLDTTFGGGDGKTTADFDGSQEFAAGMALDNAGRAVVVGRSGERFAIARFLLHKRANADFDGDGKTDTSVFNSSDGVWRVRDASGDRNYTWGIPGDQLVPADYDGDGKADVAVWRPSTGEWFVINSRDGAFSKSTWGIIEDQAVPADYDGDGSADLAIYRPSSGQWFIVKTSGGFETRNWGEPGDVPVVGDFDGDLRADISVWRPSSGVWCLNRSTAGIAAVTWGVSTDRVVNADYDGDQKDDIAVWRPSTGEWFVIQSSDGAVPVSNWGVSGDIPVPGDYDGDGQADLAIYRSGAWYLKRSTHGIDIVSFGTGTDVPVPAALLR